MKARKIVVNARALRKNQMDGLGWFACNSLKEITVNHPEIEFHFLFDSGIDESFLFSRNIIPTNLFPPAKHALLNIAWFEWSVKRYLNKTKPDLFFSPDGILCLGWHGKQYGVMHDINFYHRPQDLKFTNRKYYNYYFPKFAKKAERLATVSEYSRHDISQVFNLPKEKIDVVYCGINSFYRPLNTDEITAARNKYTSGQPYFIFIGTLSPRKNILNLMKSFELFRSQFNTEIKLIIAGGGMFRTQELLDYKQQMNFGKDVIMTGRVDDAELNLLLGAALAMTFVPYFEGFGIPLIEAMQCNIPIIASNVTSVPEITGDAAIHVEPDNVDEIKNAMLRITTDENLRRQLIEKGTRRKEFFSWQKTAGLLWQGVERCL